MIFVFKTSVKTKMHVQKLKPYFDKIIRNGKWNFDLEDIDKILHIDTEGNIARSIIDLLNIHSYNCVELE